MADSRHFVFFAHRPGRTVAQMATCEGSKRVFSASDVPFGISMMKNSVLGQNP